MIRSCYQIVTARNKSLSIGFSKTEAVITLANRVDYIHFKQCKRLILSRIESGEYRFVHFYMEFNV